VTNGKVSYSTSISRRASSDLLAIGGDGRDLVADVADGLVEQDGVLEPVDLREVGVADDGPNAVQGLGARGVDLRDAGVGMGAAEDFRVDLARQAHVVGILGAPGDLEVAFDARGRLPDDAQVGVFLPGRQGAEQRVALLDLVLGLAFFGVLALDVGDGHARPPAPVAPAPIAANSAARSPALTMFW
jgi:hypothetical protein